MILALCHPVAGADPDAFAALLPRETDALRVLAAAGSLTHAWASAPSGAVLLFDTDAETASQLLADLPLARAGLMEFQTLSVRSFSLDLPSPGDDDAASTHDCADARD